MCAAPSIIVIKNDEPATSQCATKRRKTMNSEHSGKPSRAKTIEFSVRVISRPKIYIADFSTYILKSVFGHKKKAKFCKQSIWQGKAFFQNNDEIPSEPTPLTLKVFLVFVL